MLRAITIVFVAFLTVLSLGACAIAQTKTLTILHTNDMHASFVPREATWIRTTPRPHVGGMVELAAVVDSIRQLRPALLMDAGDVMTGNPAAEIDYAGATGGALFEMMNRIGYEIWTPGNHDFDISRANFLRLSGVARFPIVCANLFDEEGRLLGRNLPSHIIEKNGIRIGVIGWMSSAFYNLVSRSSTAGIKLETDFAVLQRLVDELDPKTDLIIALTHQGVEDDSVLAAKVRGLDVIIGGHSHTRLRKPVAVNGVVIAQAGSNCENLGIVNLTVENDRVTAFDGELKQLWIHTKRPASPLSQLVDSIQTQIDAEYAAVIGSLATDWKRENGESGIGNFITDAQREAVRADVAFMNNHGIRADAVAGEITKRKLFEILPFRNTLVTFTLTGAQVRTIIEHFIQLQSRDRESVQTSGIRCRWRKGADKKPQIVELTVNGEPLDEQRLYVGAASDYLMGESQRYLGIPAPTLDYTNQTVFGVVEQKIRQMQSIDSTIEGRIKELP